jgi:hypothetical protein
LEISSLYFIKIVILKKIAITKNNFANNISKLSVA